MGQKGVESLLGRLITDADFRRRFRDEPAAACMDARLEVTTRELEAVLNIEPSAIDVFALRLDPRIVRASIAAAHPLPASVPARAKKRAATSG